MCLHRTCFKCEMRLTFQMSVTSECRKLTVVENIKFVHEVQKHEILYNHKLPHSTNRDLKNAAWKEVSKAVNISGIENCYKLLLLTWTQYFLRIILVVESSQFCGLMLSIHFLKYLYHFFLYSDVHSARPYNLLRKYLGFIRPQILTQHETGNKLNLK